jgi:hypothetical protein
MEYTNRSDRGLSNRADYILDQLLFPIVNVSRQYCNRQEAIAL